MFNHCGHIHERGFNPESIAGTIEKARVCPMRKGNMLCCHHDLFDDIDPVSQALEKAQEVQDTQAIRVIVTIEKLNRKLDNLVRSSHIGGLWGGRDIPLPEDEVWTQTSQYLRELISILVVTVDKNQELDSSQRQQFDALVLQIQQRSSQILGPIVQILYKNK